MKRPNVVYLSSSAHSDWRSTVKTQYQHSADVILVGPCEEHGLSDTMGAPGDLRPGHKLRITQMLSKSHILFGYIPVICLRRVFMTENKMKEYNYKHQHQYKLQSLMYILN